jgi:hypothetical protein
VNPLDLLRGLGGAVGGSSALDPLTKASTALTTQLRKAGLIPNKGIKPEYGGPNAAYYGPAYANAQALGLGGERLPLRNYGPGYKEKELAAGAAAERFRPGAGFPGQQGAADRAYQQEKDRVTQMTEQDPLFKKYKVAELTKAYNTASPEEKNKIGLQIWATTNPELAAKLKPGQTGYQEAYDLLGTQTFGTVQPVSTKVNFEQSTEKTGAPTPELPTGFAQAYTNPVPNFGMGINMQQTAYAPEGQSAPEMVSPDFSNVPLMSPPKEPTYWVTDHKIYGDQCSR